MAEGLRGLREADISNVMALMPAGLTKSSDFVEGHGRARVRGMGGGHWPMSSSLSRAVHEAYAVHGACSFVKFSSWDI